MSNLLSYGMRDWVRAAPLVDGVRLARNALLDGYFRRQRSAEAEEFLAHFDAGSCETLAVCVAFNTPWLIDLMARAAALNLKNATLLIVDNSNEPGIREENARICRKHGLNYLPLPYNPVRHASRSHGVALNWTFENVIRPIKPRVFAFLDHDLFPLSPVDLAERVANQPVYGRILSSAYGWNVWAGYCIFDFEKTSGRSLDFNIDKSRDFDTGGRNWVKLYRYLDVRDIELTDAVQVAPQGLDGQDYVFELMDEFLHIRNGFLEHARGFIGRRELVERLIASIEDGTAPQAAMEGIGLHVALPAHTAVRPRSFS